MPRTNTVTIVLAHPWDGHAVGDEIKVSPAQASRLRSAGVVDLSSDPTASASRRTTKAAKKTTRKPPAKKTAAGPDSGE